jgi:hypothetical protein
MTMTMRIILLTDIEKILPEGIHVRLSPAERDALLEIAALAMAADGILRNEEFEVFINAMRRLYGTDADMQTARRKVEQMVEQEEWDDTDARLDELAASLSPGFARELAFKLGCLMTVCDFTLYGDEIAFDNDLRSALGLTPDEAEKLTAEVVDSIEMHHFP